MKKELEEWLEKAMKELPRSSYPLIFQAYFNAKHRLTKNL